MTETAIGEVTLTPLDAPGISLTLMTDPEGVTTTWDPRKHTEAGIEGAQTTQDAGMFAIDCFRTLAWSGNGQWLQLSDVRQLRAWLGVAGSTYRYEDSEGNDWTVEFVPPFRADRDFRAAGTGWYTATVTLHVLAMLDYLGEPYFGA